jgi:hypothetical protein
LHNQQEKLGVEVEGLSEHCNLWAKQNREVVEGMNAEACSTKQTHKELIEQAVVSQQLMSSTVTEVDSWRDTDSECQ